jgi:hypothetical protein
VTTLLERREIEARVLIPVFDILARDLGPERAEAVLREAIDQDAQAAGAAAAAGVPPDQLLAHFAAIQDQWRAGGALDAENTAVTAEEFAYTVRHCAYADLYERLGRRDLGAILSCHRDAAFARGYDPAMTLDRPATIMQGAPRCEFRYRRPAAAGPPPHHTLPTRPPHSLHRLIKKPLRNALYGPHRLAGGPTRPEEFWIGGDPPGRKGQEPHRPGVVLFPGSCAGSTIGLRPSKLTPKVA